MLFSSHKKFLICKEKANREKIVSSEKYKGLYPILEDPEFNKKISLKKEFENTIYVKKTQEEKEILALTENLKKNSRLACQIRITDKLNGLIFSIS